MKITMEVDISPQEVLELFEGNVESLQRALLSGMMQMSEKAMKDGGMQPNQFYDYWRQAAEAGQNFFRDASASTRQSGTDKSGSSSGKKGKD